MAKITGDVLRGVGVFGALAILMIANLGLLSGPVAAQDPMANIDMTSDAFTKAEMTRADVEALIAKGEAIDLSGRALNGLDLSGLDLHGASLSAARLNKANLSGANLEGANLSSAWAVEANFTKAKLAKSKALGAQLIRATFDDADFTGAEAAANFAYASLLRARFDDAKLSPGKKNLRSMIKLGFQSAKLDGASFRRANMVACYLEFASLRDAVLVDAVLAGGDLAGADLGGADVAGADFISADFSSAKLAGILHLEAAKNFDQALNTNSAYR